MRSLPHSCHVHIPFVVDATGYRMRLNTTLILGAQTSRAVAPVRFPIRGPRAGRQRRSEVSVVTWWCRGGSADDLGLYITAALLPNLASICEAGVRSMRGYRRMTTDAQDSDEKVSRLLHMALPISGASAFEQVSEENRTTPFTWQACSSKWTTLGAPHTSSAGP
jgi:hypothetical protein